MGPVRPLAYAAPALAYALLDGEYLGVLVLVMAPVLVDAWVRIRVARIEAAATILSGGEDSSGHEDEDR